MDRSSNNPEVSHRDRNGSSRNESLDFVRFDTLSAARPLRSAECRRLEMKTQEDWPSDGAPSRVTFGIVSAMLMLLALALVAFGALELIAELKKSWHEGGNALLTAIGYVVIAIAVFDVAKYFVEEEVIRRPGTLTASEARRSLAKFISTIVIAVFIEGLASCFR